MYLGPYTGHARETHTNCHRNTCMVCDLFICSVCHGCEGSLLPVCPGVKLSMDTHDKNYAHYCAGTGPFAQPNRYTMPDVLAFATKYYADAPDSEGARRFYEAVVDLARYVEGLDTPEA